MGWVYLFIAIVAEVIGTSALKPSAGFTNPGPSIVVVIGYGVAIYFLTLTLRTIPVGISYAVWSGTGVALITIIGWIVFEQKLDVFALLGIGLIVSGVLVIYLLSKSTA